MIIRFFTVFVSVLSLLSACSDDSYNEAVSDLPDWDYSNVVKDSGDNVSDNDPGDTGNTAADDTGDSGADDTETADEDTEEIKKEYCGNRKVEKSSELCDTYPIDCREISVHFRNAGSALCEPDCLGYDMSLCEKYETKYGALNITFRSDYILDYGKIHGNPESVGEVGVQPYSAFMGLYDPEKSLPPEEEAYSIAYAATRPGTKNPGKRQTFVYQFSFDAADTVIEPIVELEFPEGAIIEDEYEVNTFDLFGLFPMVRLRFLRQQGDSYCVFAMGNSGTVRIIEAWQDNPVEGGILEIDSNNIDFFPPDVLIEEHEKEIDPDVLRYPACS